MKNRIFILLILTLCISFCFDVLGASANSGDFATVGDSQKENNYITALIEKGIVKGYNDGDLRLTEPCKKEQFITFLYRAADEPDAGETVSFSDVPPNAYYAKAVSWAYNNGITNGVGNGMFGTGKTIDRNLAVFYLYKWAEATGNGNLNNSCFLSAYYDGNKVEYYARTAYAWAIGDGIVEVPGDMLYPSSTVTRGWTLEAIENLVGRHYHNWCEYKDNLDGTHSRSCILDVTHTEKEYHTFNGGELTKNVTDAMDGEITYTCTKCMSTKSETVKAGSEVITRADLERAIVDTAWAYYAKGAKMQYDNTVFSKLLGQYGGFCRITALSSPEVATTETNFYSVCSNYLQQTYYEALNISPLGDVTSPFGMLTVDIFRYSDNQRKTYDGEETFNNPLTEEDVDAAIMRWLDYDRYDTARLKNLYIENVLESDSFTEHFADLLYRNDAPDGQMHYSYYDDEGNMLTPSQVKWNYVFPFVKDYEKNLRAGDVIMYGTHAVLYIGDNTILHCSGSNISIPLEKDCVEENGAIICDFDDIVNRLLAEETETFILSRPLNFVTSVGFDGDPSNDIALIAIPDETKSRSEYPMMDIDRTVDITQFGTAVSGGELTYTIQITNNTDDENYLKWYARHNNNGSGKLAYVGIKVTEKVPSGTSFVRNSADGGEYSGGVITWNLEDIVPGECVSLTYKVKVNAKAGKTIVSDGGSVDSIPSNTIENTVGGVKLSAKEREKLASISDEGLEKLSTLGTDIGFAETIYSEIGKKLELPEVTEIIDNLFTYSSHIPGSSKEVGGLIPANYDPMNLFVRQTNVSKSYSKVKSMLIDRYWGGSLFYVGDELKWEFAMNGIRDFRSSFLEAGDILIYVYVREGTGNSLQYYPEHILTMVYDGARLLCADNSYTGVSYSVVESNDVDNVLLKAVFSQLFFALRPSQSVGK